MRLNNNQSGIALLVTLLLVGVLLGIGATLLNVTLKQLQLSSIAYDSEIAFQAANAGVECALYYDFVDASDPFHVFGNGNEQATVPEITCVGNGPKGADELHADLDESGSNTRGNGLAASGDEQRFRFDWDNHNLCTEVSVYKFFIEDDNDGNAEDVDVVLPDGTNMRPGTPCPEGSECTVIQSRGYNVPCADIDSGGRVVEREYTQVY